MEVNTKSILVLLLLYVYCGTKSMQFIAIYLESILPYYFVFFALVITIIYIM